MLQPKRTKYRKQFKGKNAGLAQSGNYVAFGDYGLKATSRARMTARELEAARAALRERHSEELVLVPLHNALKFLGQITGETTTEDILSEIFATFCIGK